MTINARYVHTNLIARDWRALARFYQDVLGCVPVPPERDLSGLEMDASTGIPGAHLRGMHLRLPGRGDDGPTLEVFGHERTEPRPLVAASREGIAHVAFLVDDVGEAAARVVAAGGSLLGEVSSAEVPGVGRLTFVYAADPEGNVVELQSWN